jgi:hypothetical protein
MLKFPATFTALMLRSPDQARQTPIPEKRSIAVPEPLSIVT